MSPSQICYLDVDCGLCEGSNLFFIVHFSQNKMVDSVCIYSVKFKEIISLLNHQEISV